MELILVRHGQSEGNVSGGDVPNPPLTALGRLQAASASRAVAALIPDIIAASPLQRALQTAQPAALQTGKRIEVWKNACEVRFGPHYVGPGLIDMQALFPEVDFGEDIEADGWQYTSDVDFTDAQLRVNQLLLSLREKYEGKRVAIFLHGTLNQLLLHSLLGLGYPAHAHLHFNQPNGCINRIHFDPGRVFVHSIADVSHLLADGIEIT